MSNSSDRNGGKVYYILNDKLNNNLIKIVQKYNIVKIDKLYFNELRKSTNGIYRRFDSINEWKKIKNHYTINNKNYWYLVFN
jgi:hypothetical protein